MNKLRQILFKTALTLIFLLVIMAMIQFVMWAQANRTTIDISSIDRNSSLAYLAKQYGVGQPFIPDFWPFDNHSIWTGTNLFTGK